MYIKNSCIWYQEVINQVTVIPDVNGVFILIFFFCSNQFFDHTIGINVAQSRYLPVNSTSDLLLLQVML